MQKLYCYIDETGQDTQSEVFVVVAVVSEQEQNKLREELINIEQLARTGHRKWHKSKPERRLKYLEMILAKKIGKEEVFFASYQKPLPYFLPILETIERAIKLKAKGRYQATICVDGIDKKKAQELTNALHLREVKTSFIKGKRDEAEPLIRLADMWAGCIRAVFLKRKKEIELVERAEKYSCLVDITKNPSF
ncbi:MAG: DUF3800 domain-containing protein [Candidatus Pacebacteria bacterium]|nr:DUF3800 domain-containing protein [Candidatus Paceibacterota bacterium]